MASLIDPALSYIERGLFREALAQLETVAGRIPPGDADTHKILLAEMLARTGARKAASQLAHGLLARRKLTRSQEAWVLTILAETLRDGNLEEALTHINRAIGLAAAEDDPVQLARSQLELLIRLMDVLPTESLIPHLSSTRRTVIQSGELALTVRLHTVAAELEARLGSLGNALRHLDIAAELTNGRENVWLDALIAGNRTIILSMQSDYRSALQSARFAAQQAAKSGAVTAIRPCEQYIGILNLYLGNIERARSLLEFCSEPESAYDKAALNAMDSLAQLELAAGNLDTCDDILGRVSSVVADNPSFQNTWVGRSVRDTRIRLLQRQGRWITARDVARAGIDSPQTDHFFETTFKLLDAESSVMLGETDAVPALLNRLPDSPLPLAALSELERIQGKAAVMASMLGRAREHYERSLRILMSIGHAYLRMNVCREYGAWCRNRDGAFDDRALSNPNLGLFAEPAVSIVMFPDNATPLIPDAATEPGSATLPTEFGHHADLLGYESLELFRHACCVQGVALVCSGPDQRRDVLMCAGWSYAKACHEARQPDAGSQIDLGNVGETTFHLIVGPSADAKSARRARSLRATIRAIAKLAKLESSGEPPVALWTTEDVTRTADGIYIADRTVEILRLAKKVAAVDIPVLVTGETGTGKELLARAIHRASPRSSRSFLAFNCTAVSRDMIDSQLFGYRRGAFTGAQEQFAGVIRTAGGGTVFLDEVGELSIDIQPKLLRFLESREIHPLGEGHPLVVDVRVVAATNADLDVLVAQGRFREDLFYRLNVVRFHMPPLRERREEIPSLADYFLRTAAAEFHKGRIRFADETLEHLLLYRWPGNIRQLSNEIRRMAALADPDAVLRPKDLTSDVFAARKSKAAGTEPTTIAVQANQTLPQAIAELERLMVTRALGESEGHLESAAERLGISRKGLYLKRHKLGID
jgi:DNA-binding NtrC family response regulator/tetratricopeptide (TPR) repeat protein